MKKIMAVFDEDGTYAERLSDYVNKKEKGIFTAQAFTSREKLKEYAKEHKIDILLAGEEALKDFSWVASGQQILLMEEQGAPAGGGPGIYKYQSGDDIIREVMAAYCESPEAAVIPGLKSRGKRIVGIYSPVNRCGKTSLALAVGQLIAKEEKTLFVSLDTFTGFQELFNERWKRDLSDLIYFYKQGRYNALRLNSLVYYIGDLAWLPPIRFPEDYSQVSVEELAGILVHMLDDSAFETVILDVGDYGKQAVPLLECCQAVYMPVKEDPISKAKLKEFDEYLQMMGKEALREKLCEVHVPMVTGIKRMEHFPQELLWGDMGDFVRRLLKGQRGIWEN